MSVTTNRVHIFDANTSQDALERIARTFSRGSKEYARLSLEVERAFAGPLYTPVYFPDGGSMVAILPSLQYRMSH